MKKFLSIILAIVFTILLVGCDDSNTNTNNNNSSATDTVITDKTYKAETNEHNTTNNNNSSATDTVIADKTYKAETNEQTATTEKLPEIEILSAEDKAVKEEIAKYRETDIDFRYNKQETIKGKTFDVVFSEIEYATDYKRVLYKNGSGDEFAYDTDNGKLRYAVMESAVTPKTTESINQEKAREIAVEYVSSNCDIDKYTMDQCKEIDSGYYFCFTRYIGGYPSSDRYGIQIGYNGDVVYLSDTTYVFTDKNIDFDKNFIDAKIKEYSDESEVDWDSIKICIHEGKVAVEYTETEQHAIAILPLE